MLLTFLVAMAGACALSFAASVLMAWASNRSALWNMMFAVVFLLAVLAGVLLIAFLLTQTAFPN